MNSTVIVTHLQEGVDELRHAVDDPSGPRAHRRRGGGKRRVSGRGGQRGRWRRNCERGGGRSGVVSLSEQRRDALRRRQMILGGAGGR